MSTITSSCGAPHWPDIPFDVPCGRCGERLNGHQENRCARCGLDFDWADAVPLEHLCCAQCGYRLCGLRNNRCPECGHEFSWDERLAAYRRSKIDLFEYRWREAPVRSAIGTWRRTCLPRRFWRSLDIHDPPAAGALLVYLAVFLLVMVLLYVVVHGGLEWVTLCLVWVRAPEGGHYSFAPNVGLIVGAFANTVRQADYFILVVPLLMWQLATCVSLLVFQQSMRRFRIRVHHVLRVGAYGVTWSVPIWLAAGFGQTILESVYWWVRLGWVIVAGGLVLCAGWSIMCGYRYYLRMDHAPGVALASQAMAVLAAGAIEFWTSARLDQTVVFSVFRFFGI